MEPAGKFKVNEGDWICTEPSCGNLNFARRMSCNRCNKEKDPVSSKKKLGQEIGKVAAEKSRGLFSAEDWLCTKCCNINWARRSSCNMCNAPRFEAVEERTGYGGGYNDRGVVEYVRRDDSDDEYDEFGRRKKKTSRSGDTKKDQEGLDNEEIMTPIEHGKEGEEEDEEEDGDDGDLSKYDLTEWDDLAEEINGQKDRDRAERSNFSKDKSIKSRSRSRSRSK